MRARLAHHRAAAMASLVGLALAVLPSCGGPDPHLDAVPVIGGSAVSFTPGPGAGFNGGMYPEIVEGGPEGAGESAGGLDVLSLGAGGTLVLDFPGYVLCDGPGPDLLVFENAFHPLGDPTVTFAEPIHVGVGDAPDGSFTEWPCAPDDAPYPGCAGVTPVLASSANGIDPTDPTAAGGDAFDLADLGIDELRYIRLRDADLGDPPAGATNFGADVDAIVALHACPVGN